MKQQGARRVVLLANGILTDVEYARAQLRADDWIVAANGGTRLAAHLGLVPDLLVGDGDSLSQELRAWLDDHEVPRLSFPRAKDATDLELALWHAAEHGASEILLLGATGGRIDHTIANLSLLAAAVRTGLRVEAIAGREHLYLIQDRLTLAGQVGDVISLLPWGGDAAGVSTQGLRWPLLYATLSFGSTRGISNEMVATEATIVLDSGLLMVAHQREQP